MSVRAERRRSLAWRLGDLTPRYLHYQTAPAGAVNAPTKPRSSATIDRAGGAIDGVNIMTKADDPRFRRKGWVSINLTFLRVGGLLRRVNQQRNRHHGKRLRDLCASLRDDVTAYPPHELPVSGPARDRRIRSRLLRLADSWRWPRYPCRYRL